MTPKPCRLSSPRSLMPTSASTRCPSAPTERTLRWRTWTSSSALSTWLEVFGQPTEPTSIIARECWTGRRGHHSFQRRGPMTPDQHKRAKFGVRERFAVWPEVMEVVLPRRSGGFRMRFSRRRTAKGRRGADASRVATDPESHNFRDSGGFACSDAPAPAPRVVKSASAIGQRFKRFLK